MKNFEENDIVEQIQREGMKSSPAEAGRVRIRTILIYEWGLFCNVVVRLSFGWKVRWN
jgi:hypothetical protein